MGQLGRWQWHYWWARSSLVECFSQQNTWLHPGPLGRAHWLARHHDIEPYVSELAILDHSSRLLQVNIPSSVWSSLTLGSSGWGSCFWTYNLKYLYESHSCDITRWLMYLFLFITGCRGSTGSHVYPNSKWWCSLVWWCSHQSKFFVLLSPVQWSNWGKGKCFMALG